MRHLLIVLIFVGIVVGAPLQAQDLTQRFAEFEALRQQTAEAFQEGEVEEAIRLSEAANNLFPGHGPTLYNLTLLNALVGNLDAAVMWAGAMVNRQMALVPPEGDAFQPLRQDARFISLMEEMEGFWEQGNAEIAFETETPLRLGEGIVHDPETGAIFISSVVDRSILRIDENRRETIILNAEDGRLLSPMGMSVDNERGILWVAHSGLVETNELDPSRVGEAGVLGLSLEGFDILYDFPLMPEEGSPRVLGDVVPGPDGTLFASDSISAALYQIDIATGQYRRLPIQSPVIRSPQGLAWHEGILWFADWGRGVFRYNMYTNELSLISPPENASLLGIDGFYRHEDGSFLAIQNGLGPNRVVRILVDGEEANVEVLAMGLEEFLEPTLGTIVGDEFLFIANSGWPIFGAWPARGDLPEAFPITVMSVPLN